MRVTKAFKRLAADFPSVGTALAHLKKEFAIRNVCTTKLNVGGFYRNRTRTIAVNPRNMAETSIINTIFHEAIHSRCYDRGIYPDYHNIRATREEKRKCCWMVERYVDRMAAREQKKLFPNMPYIGGYNTKQDKEWLLKFFTR